MDSIAASRMPLPVFQHQATPLKSSCSTLFGSRSSRALLVQPNGRHRQATNVRSLAIKSEQTTDDGKNSLDIWVGRAAMVGFVAALAVEIATGKGVLENVGLATPLPTVALGLTALVGTFAAFKVFQSSD